MLNVASTNRRESVRPVLLGRQAANLSGRERTRTRATTATNDVNGNRPPVPPVRVRSRVFARVRACSRVFARVRACSRSIGLFASTNQVLGARTRKGLHYCAICPTHVQHGAVRENNRELTPDADLYCHAIERRAVAPAASAASMSPRHATTERLLFGARLDGNHLTRQQGLEGEALNR